MINLCNAIALVALFARYTRDQANGPKIDQRVFARQNAGNLSRPDVAYCVY